MARKLGATAATDGAVADHRVRFLVIGAGVSGLATAFRLGQAVGGDVLVLEKERHVGGLCASVRHDGTSFDLGSHRIHEQSSSRAMGLLREVLPERMLVNERGGRLRLLDTYIDYPITSAQMFRALGWGESLRCGASLALSRARALARSFTDSNVPANYERYLLDRAGERAYRLFYEPYARKVWGCEPSEISITAVKKRVSMAGPAGFLKDVAGRYLGRADPQRYYYPPGGIGTLPEALERHVTASGGRCVTGVEVCSIRSARGEVAVRYRRKDRGTHETAVADAVVSTIPLDELFRLAAGEAATPPGTTFSSSSSASSVSSRGQDPVPEGGNPGKGGCALVEWTGLRLAYLRFDRPPLLDGETFYFPELKYVFGRVSVPQRYSPRPVSGGGHWLICEVPCGARRETPSLSTRDLEERCIAGLVEAGLVRAGSHFDASASFVVDMQKVYPVYRPGWEAEVERLLHVLAERHPQVYASGRPGLFLHNNLDHSIDIGLALAEHLLEGGSARAWYARLSEFHGMRLRD